MRGRVAYKNENSAFLTLELFPFVMFDIDFVGIAKHSFHVKVKTIL